jgi:hypothetical protein
MLTTSYLPTSFSNLLHHRSVEVVVELRGLVAPPSVVEVHDENLLVCGSVEAECPTSVLADEGC